MHLLEHLKQNPFVLAPMAGITDHAFRSFMKSMGCGVVVTELVSATGIEYKSDKTLKLMSFDKTQHPIGIQLFGDDPELLGKAAKLVEEMGADFVDLNFGCPVPKVVKKGAGSAMMKDLVAMRKVLRATKSAVSIPVTIKIRTGWDQNSRNASDVVQLAYDEGITWVAIHGRTRAAGYSGDADWDFIREVKAKSPMPILGNGDITSAQLAVQRLQESSCDGVLIGRGALKNPYIFQESLALWKKQNQRIEKDIRVIFTGLKDSITQHCDDHIVQIQLRKFAAWFSAGYPDSAGFRKMLFSSKSVDHTMEIADEYFSRTKMFTQEDTSREAFLMGGHG